jgi:membrane protein involved in colicin uptake
VSIAPGGSSGSRSTLTAREVSAAVATTEKAVETRTTEEVVAAKAAEEAAAVMVVADEAATVKATADKAMVAKVAGDKVVVMKAIEGAMAKAAVDAAAMKTVDQGAVVAKTSMELVGSGSGSSRAPVVGSKRVAALGGSTPPSKWFYYTWKPQYAEQLCSCLLLVIYLYCI